MNDFWVHRELLYYMESGIHKGNPEHKDTFSVGDLVKNYQNQHDEWIGKDLKIGKGKEGEIRNKEIEQEYKNKLFGDSSENQAFQNALRQILKEKGYYVEQGNLLKGVNTDLDLSDAEIALRRTLSDTLTKFSTVKSIKTDHYKKAKNALEKLIHDLNIGKINKESELIKDLDKVKGNYNTAIEEIRAALNVLNKDAKDNNTNIILNNTNRASVEVLNKYIDVLSKQPVTSSGGYAQGQIGEIIAAAMGYSIAAEKQLIQEDLEQYIESNLAGEGVTYLKRDKETGQITSEISYKKGDLTAEIKNEYKGVESHTNKTDVIITEVDASGNVIGKSKQSIKNYNNFNGLTLVSGTPLSNIVETYGNQFIPHYGNMLERNKADQMRSGEPEFASAKKEINNYRKQMQKIIYEAALRQALMGYSKEADIPEVFVVFNSNNTKDPVRIFRTGPLLQKLIENFRDKTNKNMSKMELGQSVNGKIKYDTTLEKLKMPSGDEPNKYNNVMSMLYNHKVHMQISVGAIKD